MVKADSDGMPHNFEAYTGSAVRPPELPDIGNFFLWLSQQVPNSKNHKLQTHKSK